MRAKRIIAACMACTIISGMAAGMPQRAQLPVMTASAESAVKGTYEDVFSYEAYDDHVVITKYSGSDTEASVPASIDGVPVTEIGKYAFRNNLELKKLELPASIERIGEGAFYSCSSLTDVTLPGSLTELGDAAFSLCISLKEFAVAPGNKTFSVKDGILYDASESRLLIYPAGRTDSEFTIPDNVKAVGNGAFIGCKRLVSVTMPDTVESTGEGVFAYCFSLEKVVLSAQITELPYLYLYNTSADWVGYFEDCPSLKDITISDKLEKIGAYAFCGCEGLESFVIPDSVTEVGIGTFSRCTSLTSLTLGKNISDFSVNAVYGDPLLSSILVAKGNKTFSSIDGVLFGEDGTSLILYPEGKQDSEYKVPEGTTKISGYAFEDNTYLESVILPESLSVIESNAFRDSRTLSRVVFPDAFLRRGNICMNAFYGTPYLTAMKADKDGYVISEEGVLFSAPDKAEALTVPSSVKLVAGGAVRNSSLLSMSFEGDCHLSTYAFYSCSSLLSVDVKGDCILESEAFYKSPLKSLSLDGVLKTNSALPGSLEALSYSRAQLEYSFSEAERKDTVNVAASRTVSADTVAYSTYSNNTGYNNGFWEVDTLQEVETPSGEIYAVCGIYDAVTLIPYDEKKAPVVIEKEGFTFGAAAADDGHLYIVWGKSIPDSDIREEMETENIVFSKYDMQGALVAECGIPVKQSEAQFPFDAGNANMLIKDDILGCLFNTEWLKSSDGFHHQGAEFAAVDIRTMELTQFSSWEGSHSFGSVMIPTEYGFAAIHMGDVSRGFVLNTYYAEGSSCKTSYLNSNGYYVMYHGSGQYGTNANQLDGNSVYLHMGGLAKSSSTYAAAGRSERIMTSDIYRNSELRTGVYDVFVKLTDSSLCSETSGLAGEDRIDEATGEVADRNVVWLTSLNEKEKAGQVKIVTMEDGSYCVLWELFKDGVFDSVRYVIMDECGNILRSETQIKHARLSDTSIQPVVKGSTLIWAVADNALGGVTWYSADLEQFEDFSSRFSPTEELAKKYGLEYTLEEGKYGVCGENAYWVYLDDSDTLLIAGEGDVHFMGNAPWYGFSGSIIRGIIGEGITGIKGGVFEDCISLTEAVLPDTATEIGDDAFYGCSSLEEITIPDSVTRIGRNAFFGCRSLSEIVIPDNVAEIDDFAFSDCTYLEKVTLPEGLTRIGDSAFKYCSSLRSVCIPGSVKEIGMTAFFSCTKLRSIMLFGQDTEIGDRALGYYYSYSGEQTLDGLIIYGLAASEAADYAAENEIEFENIDGECGKNAAWRFDADTGTLRIIGSGEMYDLAEGRQPWAEFMSQIKAVEIDDRVTSVGAYAFAGAENLKGMILNENITRIGSSAFDKDCVICGKAGSAAETFAKENGITFIRINGLCGENAVWYFDEATGELSIMGSGPMTDHSGSGSVPWYDIRDRVTAVSISEGITSVGSYSFYYCRNMEYVYLPETIERIGEYAFYYCDTLPVVVLPESLKVIEDSAFKGCIWLRKIVLLNAETDIAELSLGYITSNYTVSGVTLYGYAGSTAEAYAERHGIGFACLDDMGYAVKITVHNPGNALSGIQMIAAYTDENGIQHELQGWIASGRDGSESFALTGLTAGRLYEIYAIPADKDGKLLEEHMVSACFYISDEDGNIYTESENGELILSENGIDLTLPEIMSETTATTTTITTTASSTGTSATASTTTTAPPPDTAIPGDPTGNGIIDAVDASYILALYARVSTNSEAAPTEYEWATCDVNRDDLIDAVDASLVLAYYTHISTGGTLSFEEFMKAQ